jgi:hypothetical protein
MYTWGVAPRYWSWRALRPLAAAGAGTGRRYAWSIEQGVELLPGGKLHAVFGSSILLGARFDGRTAARRVGSSREGGGGYAGAE